MTTLDILMNLRTDMAQRTMPSSPPGVSGYRGWSDPEGGWPGHSCLMISCAKLEPGSSITNNQTETLLLLADAAIRLFPDRTGCRLRDSCRGVDVNNHPDTTHDDVMLVIDAAIAAAGGTVPMEHPERSNAADGVRKAVTGCGR